MPLAMLEAAIARIDVECTKFVTVYLTKVSTKAIPHLTNITYSPMFHTSVADLNTI